jgi:competence protein ComGC
MRLPTKEEFDALRFALWNIFEIVLMLIAMASVIVLALKHIPRLTKSTRQHTRPSAPSPQ